MSEEYSLSRTKIIIPQGRPDILHRARLLTLFDNILDQKLILITAPAGYGKTTLLVDYSHQSDMPVCWLSLDSLDRDPQRFSSYLVAAISEQFKDFGRRSSLAIRNITNFEQDTEGLVAAFVNEIYERIGEHFILVVDDYHEVDSVPAIRDFFSRFISLMGENCHVLLSSRRLPTIPDIALLIAHGQVSGFDLEELAFNPEEIQGLFTKIHNIHLGGDDVEILSKQTEGWITGLLLLESGMKGLPGQSLSLQYLNGKVTPSRVSQANLAAYLDEQVLIKQSREMRDFLLNTSLFGEFDVDLCKKILGKGRWKYLFDKVQNENLFVMPVGHKGNWLRYHHLFSEFLQQRMLDEFPDAAGIIRKKLAQVHEQQGEWEKAYALVRLAGSDEDLADLVERAGIHVLLNERFLTLQSWLEVFPETLLENRPILLSLKGALLCSRGDGKGALPLLDQAVAALGDSEDRPGLALALVRRAAARRIIGDYEGAIQDSEKVLAFKSTGSTLRMEIAEANRFKGICMYRLGRMEMAETSLKESLRLYLGMGEVESTARLQMELGLVCRASGKLGEAERLYRLSLKEWERENNLVAQANTMNNLAVLYTMQGDYGEAVSTLEQGMTFARQGGLHWQEALLLATLGDILTDLDELDSASHVYARATMLAHQVSYQFLVNYLLIAQGRLARIQGRYKESHSSLQKVKNYIPANGSKYELGLLSLEEGCLSLSESNMLNAMTELKKALAYFSEGNLQVEIDWANLYLSAALAAGKDALHASPYLESVAGALSHVTRDNPLVHRLRRVAHLLARLPPSPTRDTILQRAASAEKRLPGLRKQVRRELKSATLQTCRLSIRALGKPQVCSNGKQVTLSMWQSHSARDLFFYFLYINHPVTKEEIGEAVWPDLSPGKLKLRFKNTLYRLRRALGQDVVRFDDRCYFINSLLDFEYDVDEFERLITLAERVKTDKEKTTHLKNAIDLWRGPYLQGVDATWLWPERQRLENICFDAYRQLINIFLKNGDRKAALAACQNALKIDPCLEDIHRTIMQIHAETGDRLAVIWQYQECQNALKNELELTPSQETQALYEQLTQ